ncbi:helix-turn-helix domain-containing protein [Colwellia sp. RE-S-Sl-9]
MQKAIPNYRIYGDFDTDFSLNPVYIDDIKSSSALNNWIIEPHRHDDLYHLGYFFSGGGSMQIRGNNYTITSPSFCIIPAGDVHRFNVQNDIEGIMITISKIYMDQLLVNAKSSQKILDQPSYINNDEQPELSEVIAPLFRQLRAEYSGRQPDRSLSIQCLLGLILTRITRLILQGAHNDKGAYQEDRSLWLYRSFQNMIGYPLVAKKSVPEYAAQLRISATHLNRICQAIAGKSALQVIHIRIISEAKINLAYTFQSVSEVAYRLGFEDVSYFSRFFKKQTGITPKKFKVKVRRQHHINDDVGNEDKLS